MAVDEEAYDRVRAAQWLAGTASARGYSRRTLLRAAGLGAAVAGLEAMSGAGPALAAPPGPIVKPLPPELFTVLAPTPR
jgi:hypothetical protein